MTTCTRKDPSQCSGSMIVGPLVTFTTDGEIAIRSKEDHPQEWHFYADGYITLHVSSQGIDRQFHSMPDVLSVNQTLRDMMCHLIPQQNPMPYDKWLKLFGPTDAPECPKYAPDKGVAAILHWAIYFATVAHACSPESGRPAPSVKELN